MDVEKLITAVERRPMLYDKMSPDYNNRKHVNSEWKKIAEEVGCDERDARRRWKKLRDYFQRNHRELKSSKSGSAKGTKKKWYLYDRMLFILPHILDRGTSNNMYILCSDYEEDIDSEDAMSQSSASSLQLDTPIFFPTTTTTNDDEAQRSNPPTQQKADQKPRKRQIPIPFPQHRAAQLSDFEAEMLKAAKRFVVATEVDEDEHFFKSLAPSIKLLSAIDKMECRAEIQMVVLKFMRKAERASSTAQQPDMMGPHSPPKPNINFLSSGPSTSISGQAQGAVSAQPSSSCSYSCE